MNRIQNRFRTFGVMLVFAVAMGFLEAIVVVYIRELYYPEGFSFPLKALPAWLVGVEWIREICTLLMLGAVAWLAGKVFLKRLAAFLFLFGVWDIFYYIALKVFLGWPASLLTWDILFLIPITWVGPVLAPVLNSVLMILMAFILDKLMAEYHLQQLLPREWILLISGAGAIFLSYIADFGLILIKGGFLRNLSGLAKDPAFLQILTTWEPSGFRWGIYTAGMLLIVAAILLFSFRAVKSGTESS